MPSGSKLSSFFLYGQPFPRYPWPKIRASDNRGILHWTSGIAQNGIYIVVYSLWGPNSARLTLVKFQSRMTAILKYWWTSCLVPSVTSFHIWFPKSFKNIQQMALKKTDNTIFPIRRHVKNVCWHGKISKSYGSHLEKLGHFMYATLF